MDKKVSKAFRAAFPDTLPIMAGFLFLGTTYGILMKVSGFPIWLSVIISIVVFAGSMQFVAVDILLSAFNPVQAFLMTLMINARHFFTELLCLINIRKQAGKKLI